MQEWFTFDRLHGLPVDEKSQTIVKKVLNEEKIFTGFATGAYRINQPFAGQSKDLQRVCNALSSSHNQNLLAELKQDPNFSTALKWVWKSHNSNFRANLPVLFFVKNNV